MKAAGAAQVAGHRGARWSVPGPGSGAALAVLHGVGLNTTLNALIGDHALQIT
jgi:hypothetical protein